MKNILVISGHPQLSRSVANRIILDEIQAHLPHAILHRPDEHPDGRIPPGQTDELMQHIAPG